MTTTNNLREKEIGAFWKRKSSKGNVYFTGQIGNKRVMMFAETPQDEKKQPVFRVFEQEI